MIVLAGNGAGEEFRREALHLIEMGAEISR